MREEEPVLSRRKYLVGTSTLFGLGLSGCVGDSEDKSDEEVRWAQIELGLEKDKNRGSCESYQVLAESLEERNNIDRVRVRIFDYEGNTDFDNPIIEGATYRGSEYLVRFEEDTVYIGER